MIELLDAAQMRALDAATISLGLPAFTLMETAGRGVAARILAADPVPRTVAVVCGSGGNGGDGWVAARVLRDHGVRATVYVAAAAPPHSAAAAHQGLFERTGGRAVEMTSSDQLEAHRAELVAADLLLDALLGVGLTRAVSGYFAQVIAAINESPRRWSIDLPSGLDADRGQALGACVQAHATVSLGLHKRGVVTAPGFAHAGALHLVEIGIPRALVASAQVRTFWLEESDCRGFVPVTSPLDHKGTRGHVVVIGGQAGMRGAGALASAAAMRAGAGLCTWAAPGAAAPETQLAGVITCGLPDGDELDALITGKQAICIGPGLGRDAGASALVERVISASPPLGPVVFDADALFALAQRPAGFSPLPGIVTPHPKEAARLLGVATADIEADRLQAARALVTRLGAVVVLKGARTIVSDGQHDWICSSGHPALATAGSGDVLAGVIAGLCAQGLPAVRAALLGTWIHGRAGSRLAQQLGPRGVLASDLSPQIGLELAALSPVG